MKIISKFKDYYDYLQGVYGIDSLLILDRRSDIPIFIPEKNSKNCHLKPEVSTYYVAVTGICYKLHFYKNKMYHTKEEVNWLKENKLIVERYSLKSWKEEYQAKTDVNFKLRKPILVSTYRNLNNPIDSVILEHFNFAKILSAEEIFMNLSNFLSYLKDNPEIPNKQSNNEKIVSHGFDLKTSFRHRK